MIWLIFLFFGHAYAACLNDGILEDGVCSCVGGYSGRHCQIQPYGTPCNTTQISANSDLGDSAVVGDKKLPICNGDSFPCYYRPGLPASNKCLPQFGVACPAHFSVNKSATCLDGCHPDVFQNYCCKEHAKCEEDNVCTVTKGQDTEKERLVYYVDSKGYVITHTEVGACRYSSWYFDKVPLYETIDAVLEHCQTFVGFDGYGYVCHQTRNFCTGTPRICRNYKSDPVVHRSSCGRPKYWENTVHTRADESSPSVFMQAKTYTATEVHVDLSGYYNSLDSDGSECCKYEKVCEDYNSDCVIPLKNVGSNSSQDGEEPSECCEPKKWRCDHSGYSCDTGFKENTEKCGSQCNVSFETKIESIYYDIPITSGSKTNCADVDKWSVFLESKYCNDGTPLTSYASAGLEGCQARCNGDSNCHYISFAAESNWCITSETCDSSAPSDAYKIYMVTFIGQPGVDEWSVFLESKYCNDGTHLSSYASAGLEGCQARCNGDYNCHYISFSAEYNWCITSETCDSSTPSDVYKTYVGGCLSICKGKYDSYFIKDNQCYCGKGITSQCISDSNSIRYDTYRIEPTVVQSESFCCDIDPDVTFNTCIGPSCPARYANNNLAYVINHTNECCAPIPDNHYCDTFICPTDYRKFKIWITYDSICDNSEIAVENVNHQYCVTGDFFPYEQDTSLTATEAIEKCTSYCRLYAGFTVGVASNMDSCQCRPYTHASCPNTADQRTLNSPDYGVYDYTECKEISAVDPYCNGICDNSECCAHKNDFCDTITCNATDASTGVETCNGTCAYGDCCVAGPPCDTDYICGSGNIIDTVYRCNNLKNGVCAQSEYEGTDKCCAATKECSTASYYDSNSGIRNYNLNPSPTRVYEDMPGCESRNNYVIRYKTGYILSRDDWTADAFQDNCCQYFENCEGNDICLTDKYNLGDYSHSDYDFLYCWNQGTGDQNCTTDHQNCCESETCERARTRTGGGKSAWSCNISHPFIDPSTATDIIDRVLQSETEFRTQCCSLTPPLWGADSDPDEVVWGNKIIARTTNGLSLWNSAGERTFAGDYSIYRTKYYSTDDPTVTALYYSGDILYTVERVWDTTSSSWAKGIVKYNLSTPAFNVTEGDCVAYAHYVTTPNFPANYPTNKDCVFKALRSGKGLFSRIRIWTGSTLALPDKTVLNKSNTVLSGNRYTAFPYTQINVGDTFTWTASPHYSTYGFQLMMMEEFYVLDNNVGPSMSYYGMYYIKVMGDIIVYYDRTQGKIHIGSLQNGGSTALLNYLIDSTSDKDDASIFVDIQKEGSDYLVAVAQSKKCLSYYCHDGAIAYTRFFKVSGGSAHLITTMRNYGSSTGDDKTFKNVVCSPNAKKCFVVSWWRDYFTGEFKYMLTKYIVDLSTSRVIHGVRIDLGYHCSRPPLAVSNTYVAYVCDSNVKVYAHGSWAPTLERTIAENPKFVKFSPDGSKLLLSFPSDQGSDQYMKVYKISDGSCIVGPGCTNSLS